MRIVSASNHRDNARNFTEHDWAADVAYFCVLNGASARAAKICFRKHLFLANFEYVAVDFKLDWAGFFAASASDAFLIQVC